MRAWMFTLAIASGCSSEPSRLDGLGARRVANGEAHRVSDTGTSGTSGISDSSRVGAGSGLVAGAGAGDEADQDLDRNLRELTARPLDDDGAAGAPLDRGVLGAHPRPFGPLAPLGPEMTRAEVVAAIPSARPVRDAEHLLWVPTQLAGVTSELRFEGDRLAELVYHMPLAARPLLVAAWGPPSAEAATWFDPERGWRARLGEDAIRRKVTVSLAPFAPFEQLLGGGPDGLAEPAPVLGQSIDRLLEHYGARLMLHGGIAELALPRATDVCGAPTELALELDGGGRVRRIRLRQCYDGDGERRAALAAMERQWGPATPRRTAGDQLVFAWAVRGRSVEAREILRAARGAWEIWISAGGS